jgi:hypothetical protein
MHEIECPVYVHVKGLILPGMLTRRVKVNCKDITYRVVTFIQEGPRDDFKKTLSRKIFAEYIRV